MLEDLLRCLVRFQSEFFAREGREKERKREAGGRKELSKGWACGDILDEIES